MYHIKQNSKIIESLLGDIEKLATDTINFHTNNYEKPVTLWVSKEHDYKNSVVHGTPVQENGLYLVTIFIRRNGLKNTMEFEFNSTHRNASIFKKWEELPIELKYRIALILNEKYL